MAANTADPEVNTSRRDRARLGKELVVGNTTSLYNGLKLEMPWAWDDLVQDFGIDIYDKMMLDAQVSSCIALFKASIIEDGLTISPAVTDEKEDGYKLAQEISKACNRMFEYMYSNIDDVLWDLMDSLVYGSKVAEITYELQDGMLNVKYIKPKPIDTLAYVVDQYYNIVGLSGFTAKTGFVQPIQLQSNPEDILPREKYLIFSFRMKDNNPRGKSLLRPGYDPWWRKRQTIPEYMKYLAQFAGPSIVASLSKEVEPQSQVNEDGDPTTPAEALLATLLAFRNASVAVVPPETEVEFVQSTGDGQAFRAAITDCNMEITKAILNQELATEQSRFQARAAAQVHQGILDTVIRQAKKSFSWAFVRDVIRPWVEYNWGPKVARELCPKVTLGTTEQSGLVGLMTAVSALERAGYIAPEQRPEIDKILGLPVRSTTELLKDKPAPAPVVATPGNNPAPASTNNDTKKPADNSGSNNANDSNTKNTKPNGGN
jgi:hypothetical protein